jgi:hypothetical protein
MSILSSPVLLIQQRSSQLDYVISDDHEQVVGQATQVGGRKSRKGLRAMFAGSGSEGQRVVVQVTGTDGTLYFSVDRQAGAPVAIVAPDGTVVGRCADDVVGTGQDTMGGPAGSVDAMTRMSFGTGPMVVAQRLLDAVDQPVGQINWEFRQVRSEAGWRWIPDHGTHFDANGQLIAQVVVREAVFKDQYRLQVHYQLPEPLRTLVVASPLAFDLTRT